MTNFNVILILAAFLFAVVAIYVLYAIMMYQGNKKENELQLTTKNVLEQVKILSQQGEYALVELLATKYLDRVPSHQEVRKYLAQAYYKSGKYNNAIKQAIIILKKEPNDINTRKLLGDCYIKKQMLNKAIKEYEDIFKQRSNDKEVVRTLAELYKDTEQTYASISVYNILAELVDDNSEMAEIQLILAELNEIVRDYPAAFEAYKTRLEIYPTDIPTNQRITELYERIKNYTKAIETLQYMLTFATEPKILVWIYEKLVDMHVLTEEYEKAIEDSNKLLEIQGSDKSKVKNNIADFYIKLGNFENGISILEELVMMTNSAYDVTVELAQTYISCKEYKKALDKYLELLDRADQREAKHLRNLICELYISWAIETANNSNYSESYSYLEEALVYDPTNPDIYYQKGCNKIAQKLYTESIEHLITALNYDKMKTSHTKYLLKLAEAHHNLGNFFEEKKALSDLLKIDEKNAEGLYRVGLMYITQHDSKNAEESFKQALQYDPDLIPAKYNLALIYENNNRDKAKELYIEILEVEPENEEVKNALAELASSDY